VTEGEGVATGLRKLKEEAASGNYAKAAQVGMGRACVRGPREEGWCRGGWPGWEAGRADWPLGPFWAESDEKFFSK
jgi:hypothetical protein